MRPFLAVAFLLLLAFAWLEVGAHAVTRAHVPAPNDWRAAASFVRSHVEPRDLIVAAPAWADPLLREVLGDQIDLAMAGRSDSARYERLWSLTIRGARPREAPPGPPTFERRFGRVSVQRWTLGASPVRYDFVGHLRESSVSTGAGAGATTCHLRRFPAPHGGGLGIGVLPPVERFACDGASLRSWLAPVVMEDLELQPRYCAFSSVLGPEPMRVSFAQVPLAERIVLYAGVYYEHERMREGRPILARVLIDGHEAGRLLHRDGDGWKRIEIKTTPAQSEVVFELSAPEQTRHSFCWAADVREGEKSTRAGSSP
jgi:hypothetical protein